MNKYYETIEKSGLEIFTIDLSQSYVHTVLIREEVFLAQNQKIGAYLKIDQSLGFRLKPIILVFGDDDTSKFHSKSDQ